MPAGVKAPCGQRSCVVHMSTGWAPSGLSGPLHRLLDHATVGIVAGKTLRPVEYGMRAVVVLMDANLGFDEVRAKPAGRDLQPQALEGHGVVISDNGEYFRQAAEARERPLFLHQKGRVDLV